MVKKPNIQPCNNKLANIKLQLNAVRYELNKPKERKRKILEWVLMPDNYST